MHVDTLVPVCDFWDCSVFIHCIHTYYFDLRIYTNYDTTPHALTVDSTILETFGLPFTVEKE